jgi:integrase
MNIETKLARKAQRRATRGRITDAFVKALPFDAGDGRIERDDALPGFMVRIGASKKTFAYRTEKRRGGKRFWINQKLGDWPEVTATQARDAAEALRVERKAGTLQNTSARRAKTIANVWPLYKVAPTSKGRKKAATTIEEQGYSFQRLSQEVVNTPLRELVNDQDIMVREAARMVRVNGQAASNSSIKFVRALYKFVARDRTLKLPTGHPCETVMMVDSDNEQPVLERDELSAWWKRVQAVKNPLHREAHLITLLSGLRRNDVRTLRWEHLDVKGRRFHVPSPKGGRRKAFDLILSRPMLRCLWRARRAGRLLYPGSPWVFPADSKSGHLIRLSKEKVGAINHTLRRTFGGIAKNHVDVEEEDIRRLYNHGGKGVTSVYIRASKMGPHYLDQQELISAELMKALAGNRSETAL